VYYFSDSWSEVTKDAESRTARILHGVVTRLENQVLARAALVVGVTGDLKRLAQQSGAVRVIGVANGIDTEMFTDQGDTWSPVGGNGPFFLYAGNAGLVHGAHVFVDAAVRLWQGGWSFDLVHMGYGADRFLERSAELEPWSDRIFVLGNQPAELVAAAYRGALGALSSLRPLPHYAHARPMKTMSGLACGCPAVYAGEGEFADAVRSAGLGYVQKWSVDGAELAMREALTQEASDGHQLLRSRCRQYAVSHFEERHGARIVCSAMHEVWGETVQ
jgi:glycosyltransferase involved in cell wall biosynthesis